LLIRLNAPQDAMIPKIRGDRLMLNCSSKRWVAAAALFLVACGGGGGDSVGGSNPLPVPDTVTAFFTAFDASRATSISPTGAGFLAMYDGCYLDGGRSKASSVAEFDGDPQSVEANKFRIGSTRTGLRVLADRSTTNADGSNRREMDIQYDINFADGTIDKATTATLVYDSSTGSKLPDDSLCATPENKPAWRFYGNRKVVSVSLTARNVRLERYALADGAANSTKVVYSKYISLTVEDPGRYATYATVSGPGLQINGVPVVLKLLSPRLLRGDLSLAGKAGNYVDLQDADSFSICRTATGGYADAAMADCVQYGASSNAWGSFNYPVAAEADQGFDNTGVMAGGIYTFTIYNDDGWKTVNGHAGKTPLVTYTSTLNHLPYSAVAMAGTGTSADRFPRFTSLSKTTAEIASAIRQKLAISVDATWSAPGVMPDASKLGWGSVSAYESGRANTLAADFPASRKWNAVYPAKGATQSSLPSPMPGPQLVDPTYAEIDLFYSTHNGNTVASVLTFR
jgi:hypothetical protein